jgi:hypothetical protein
MKKTNLLIILILSLGLMLTACGNGVEDSNDSIYVPPLLTASSPPNDDHDVLFDEICFDGIDNDEDALIDENCNSNFVAVGDDGIIVYSDNGTDWNVDESKSGTGKALMDIASDIASGSWVAVGSDDGAGFVIKYDVVTGLQTTDLSGIASLNGIASNGNGSWVAVGRDSDSNGIIVTIDEDFNPNIEIAEVTEQYKDVAYGDGIFIAVGLDSNSHGILRSSADWNINKVIDNTRLDSITYDENDKWFAIGTDTSSLPYSTVIIEIDQDLNDTEVGSPDDTLYDIASDGSGNLVAVGEDDQGHGIAVTSDNWFTTYDAAPGKALKGVVYGNEEWIAVGMNGTIVTSPTSTPPVISPVTSDTTKSLNAIVFKP